MSQSLLKSRIQKELQHLKPAVRKAQTQLQKYQESGDRDYVDAVALNLQNFYMGIERIFNEIARTLDGSMPQGEDWHQRLLEQMNLPNTPKRPAILSDQSFQTLNDYRGFRHVVVHRYSNELIPERIAELVDKLEPGFLQLQQELEEFCQFLDEI